MQQDADVIGIDARGFRNLFVGEVFQEKSDEGFFERVQFVDCGCKDLPCGRRLFSSVVCRDSIARVRSACSR